MKETEIRSRGWKGSQSRASGEEKRERRASSGGPRRRRPSARRSPPTSKKKEIRIGSEEGRVSRRAVALPSPRRVAAPPIVLTAPHNELRSLATRCILPVPFFTPSRSFVAAAVDRRGSLIRERSEGRASPEESLAPPPPLFAAPSSLACAVASRARGRRAVREIRHVSAVADSHAAVVLLAAAPLLEEESSPVLSLTTVSVGAAATVAGASGRASTAGKPLLEPVSFGFHRELPPPETTAVILITGDDSVTFGITAEAPGRVSAA
ncbi:uncharacterized protein [Arachis hypogaea]|uniref:uncharacterized protein n=1 Tax=Arachis hypogaea TaxID=3818 RepID=UPI000DEC4B3C|nr:uncharacterized protein LOC112740803 [Arachis hypogaea]XP_025645231.1 uncharacterized protein LOC112740803 [Arachis hypogaea]QHO52895.1 uncharacterized protein DS421_2g43110 [Arachis hypogaea]